MIDTSVIASIKKREPAAFKQMYEQCIGYVYSIVRRYVSNESDHQDVIQEIFARVFLSIESFDSRKGAFKFWLRRVVVNQCVQHYRQKKSPQLFVSLESIQEMETQGEAQMSGLSRAEIEAYLAKMPEGYRQIFMLVVIDEFSHREVGELLGISPETSRSQLSRAKNWLRRNIKTNKQKILAGGF